jgi:hypothetical protein
VVTLVRQLAQRARAEGSAIVRLMDLQALAAYHSVGVGRCSQP